MIVGLFIAATAAVPKLPVMIETARSNVKSRLATGLLRRIRKFTLLIDISAGIQTTLGNNARSISCAHKWGKVDKRDKKHAKGTKSFLFLPFVGFLVPFWLVPLLFGKASHIAYPSGYPKIPVFGSGIFWVYLRLCRLILSRIWYLRRTFCV